MGQAPPYGLNDFGKIVASSFFVLAPALYFLPLYEAWSGKKAHLTSIALLNTLLGWTIVGWVGALIWAVTAARDDAQASQVTEELRQEVLSDTARTIAPAEQKTTGDELERLASLLERNLLTREEFEAQKQKLLTS
jgi:hypothetical protein